MQEYLHIFNTKYDMLKLYVLLFPYKSYVDKYQVGNNNITINTNDKTVNESISDYIKKVFTYKTINVITE